MDVHAREPETASAEEAVVAEAMALAVSVALAADLDGVAGRPLCISPLWFNSTTIARG
jgi:hypothetical protein